MALNRSVGASGVARKTNNPSTKASGIPSATKTLRSSDHSLQSSSQKAIAQLAEVKATSGTSPKPRSGAREKGSIPGRTVPSSGGTGVNSSAKINIKSATPLPLSTHGTGGGNGPGRLPTKVVAKDRSGRVSPKQNGVCEGGRVVMTELHSKSDAAMPRVSSPLQSTSSTSLRVDKSGPKPTGTVAQTAHMKVGLPVASSNKRLSVGSLSAKPSTPAGVTKGRSPPMPSAVNSETSAKTESSPKMRKTTGIAKFQNHPSSAARSVIGTTAARSRGLPVGNVRASVGLRTIGGTDVNANANSGGRDTGTVHKDVQTKTGQPTEKADNTVGMESQSALLNNKNLGITLDEHKVSVAPNLCINSTEDDQMPKIPVHASQDFISKAFEETVEDFPEGEYFSETRSTVSENLSDFADGGLNLDLNDCLNSFRPANLSDLKEDAEGNITSIGTSMDDIYASCEDILSLDEDAVEDDSSKISDHTASPMFEESCKSDLVEEGLPVQSFDALQSHVGLTVSDHNLQVIEDDSRQHDLQIVEDSDYSDDALRRHCADAASVVCEHSLAADIPETSFHGIIVGSNLTVFGQIDFEHMRAISGEVSNDKSEEILNYSSCQSSLKDANINETLSQCSVLRCVEDAEDEGEKQPLQGGEKTISDSLSKHTERQNDEDEDFRTIATRMTDLDQELRIIEEELPGDIDDDDVDDAIVDEKLGFEDMATSAAAQKPGEEDGSMSEVTTEDASMPGANQKRRVEEASLSTADQELKNDNMKTEGKCSDCSSNGFGADGVTDSDGDGSSGPPRADTIQGTASTPTEASAAAAEVDQVKVCAATPKDDDDDLIRSFLGDSCETLKCDEYESDVDPDLMKDTDGVSAAGSAAGSCCRNQLCGCSRLIPTSEFTDIIDKNSIHINNEVNLYKKDSGSCLDDGIEINRRTQVKISEKSMHTSERIVDSSSSGSIVKVVKNGCMSDCTVVEDETLRGGSGQSANKQHPNEECQRVGGSSGFLSFGSDVTLQKSNYTDQDDYVISDTKCAFNSRDKNTSNQDGKDCKGTCICLPGGPGQLSSSFINEFSAWLPTETAATGRQASSSLDPGVSQSRRNAEVDSSRASLLNRSSVVAMDTADVKVILADGHDDLKFVDEDVEEFDAAESEGERSSIRLVSSSLAWHSWLSSHLASHLAGNISASSVRIQSSFVNSFFNHKYHAWVAVIINLCNISSS